ncbi:PhnD/SsuA/transferrin family substrate-binding protein [Kamptonema cortianum]|nr:PhnD/SsuA/transferrin family substrate-binding protein [Kamptonema cortianum]
MKTALQIGVLAHRDSQHTFNTWQATANYLSSELNEYDFRIIPLNFTEIGVAVEQNLLEFIITSPGLYVEFEALYGINRLATLKHLHMGKSYTLFGGVIFCSSQRKDIHTLADLRGKKFIAVAEHSFGGWRAAWREFVNIGIDPYRDFQCLQFGNTHDAVVYAVLHGHADAGTISTKVLEQMALEEKIDLNHFQVINQQTNECDRFPFALSTQLYPEWPFAVTQKTDSELAEKVAIALLKLPKNHLAAIAAQSEGWTIPLSYQSVHECFQTLRVHPYKDFGKLSSSFSLAVKGSNDGLWDWNLETHEIFFSSRWTEMLGYESWEINNQFQEWEKRLHPGDRDRVLKTFQQCFEGHYQSCELEYRLQHRNGTFIWILCRAIVLHDVWNKPYRMAGSHSDITKRKQAEEELRLSENQLRDQTQYLQKTLQELQQTQVQLIHSEKMSSLGQLVAGIAHEINNPVNFIYGNLNYLDEYFQELMHLLQAFQKYYPQPVSPVQEKIEEIELDFIRSDLTKLLKSIRVGTERIREIVQSLKNFSRLDEAAIKDVDIHEGIENTLLILQHRLKSRSSKSGITIQRKYGKLPLVACYPGQLNQVFMNILSNAIDALEDCDRDLKFSDNLTTHEPRLFTPTIQIQTEIIANHWVRIQISDNGSGMTEKQKREYSIPFLRPNQ